MTDEISDHSGKTISWHAATDKDKCYEMQDKYGWTLVDIKPSGGATLKVKCFFEGETEFPFLSGGLTNVSRYIIYKSRSGSQGNWESRLLAHTGSLTDILAEHFDSSNKPLPQPGDRLIEFADLEDRTDSTHYNRNGNWVVTEIDVFTASSVQNGKHSEIVICWCSYDPIEPSWMPVTEGKPVSEMLEAMKVGQ